MRFDAKSISPKNLRIQIGYAIVSLLVLGALNFSMLPERRAVTQLEFENWVGELEPKLENPALTGTPLPPITVEFQSQSRNLRLAIALDPVSTSTTSQRFARILQMAREANFFSLAPREGADITFAVKDDKRSFSAKFNAQDIEENAAAQAMLKLLEIYSKTPPE